MLSAPAGYGKTTLASQFAAHRAPLWCRLHPEDRDPAQLLGRLLAAGLRLTPPVGERTFRLFASRRDMERDGGLLTASFLDELAAGSSRRAAGSSRRATRGERLVVLDDAHAIADAREAIQWLTRFIEETSPRVRFLLTCRGPSPLPLARFALQGGAVVVGVHDLEFTSEEQQALMRSAFHLRLEPAESKTLRDALGGWVAGLVLAAQHMRRTGQAPGYEAVRGSDEEHRLGQLVSFLAEEVYAPLPARLRRALCRASLLDDLIPEAVRFLLGESEGNYLLREIARRDLFVRTLPDGASAPRFHPLFSDYLRKRLAAESEVERRRLLHRLARYWMSHDQTAHAIRALSEAGSLDQAIRLFDRTAAVLAARSGGAEAKHLSLGALATELGKGTLDSDRSLESPWVLLHSAYGERDAGRFDEATHRARAAQEHFLAQRASLSAVRAFRMETVTAVMTGRVRDSIRQGGKLLRRIPHRERVARGILNVQLGRLLLYAGAPERSRAHAAEAERLLRGTGEAMELAEASLQIATVAFTEGRWDVYLALARQVLAVFRRAGYIGRSQTLLINMAEACIYLGEEMKAVALLDEARALHPVSSFSFHRSGEALGRARALSEHGDLTGAARMFREARESVRQFGTPMTALQLEVWDGVLERRRRRLPQAREKLDLAVEGFEHVESPSWLTLARMERALVRGLEGDADEALGELRAMAETSRRLGDRKELARNWLYEARVLQVAGRACDLPLGRALRLLDREDYRVLLRKESDLSLPLLAAAPVQGKNSSLVERAIAALPDSLRARIAGSVALPAERSRRRHLRSTGRVHSPPAPHPLPHLHIRLLGAFAVRAEMGDLDFPRRASEALVALLALNHGQAVGREALAEALWPGAPAGASRNRFDVALSTARRVLEPEAGARGPFRILVTEAGMCRLAASDITVDVTEFERLAAAGEPCLERLARRRWSRGASFSRTEAERELAELKRAVSAYTGDLLPGWPYAPWTEEERSRLRDRHHRLLLGVAALARDLGGADEVADAARRVLADDPLHEEAERLFLHALAARGEKGELLKSYRAFVRRLERELGTPPSPETAALFRELTAPASSSVMRS